MKADETGGTIAAQINVIYIPILGYTVLSAIIGSSEAMGQLSRLQAISRKVRGRFYYSVPDAGSQIGLKRTQSYDAAELGLIPTERHGEKLLRVPKRPWDKRVRRLLQGRPP
jgi:hypothetical protein